MKTLESEKQGVDSDGALQEKPRHLQEHGHGMVTFK